MSTNPKRFWNLVNANKKTRGLPKEMFLATDKAETNIEKATLLNKFFASSFTKPEEDLSYPDIVVRQNPQLKDIRVHEEEIAKLLSELDTTKAPGPDCIPTLVLKECAIQLATSLHALFNLSFHLGVFPSIWKLANIAPIHKKGRKKDAANYRPISLLCILSKVLEKCVYSKIITHLSPMLHDLQHGFTKDRSTTTQLLIVYDYINQVVDNRGQVDVAFLDLSKAFDSVSHQLLCHKLQQFGICGKLLSWFKSYLTLRTQQTVVGDQTSDIEQVLSGVPQGSILGPLLFLLYINDLPMTITDPATCIALYADDAKIYKAINDIDDSTTLQEQLNNIQEWSETWKLRFNPDKCKMMRITRRINPIKHEYSMGSKNIELVSSFIDLGVIIQDNLLWNQQIASMVRKANRNLWFIKRTVGPTAPTTAKRLLYLTLVRSILEYASIIWNPISKQNLNHLESVQRRATKFISNMFYSNYKDRLQASNLLPLSYRREALDCGFLHKARAGILGETVFELCDVRPLRQNVRLDPDDNFLRLLPVNTETYANFYTRRIVNIWNSLPTETRRIVFTRGGTAFKSHVKKWYTHKLLTYFDPDRDCTWVTKCRCTVCRN